MYSTSVGVDNKQGAEEKRALTWTLFERQARLQLITMIQNLPISRDTLSLIKLQDLTS